MGGMQAWKKKKTAASRQEAPGPEAQIRRQIGAAAGAEYFDNRDPIYHITEDFQKTFDLIGSQKARERSAELFQTEMKPITPGLEVFAGEEEAPQGSEQQRALSPAGGDIAQQRGRASFLEQSSMDSMVEPSNFEGDRMFLSRFSQVAFNRGTLAGAVLRGTGKMMLFSCLKRTVGQSQPVNLRQQKLFESGSQRRNIAGNPPDQVMFNRGQAEGAVGLVVDVLKDARRVVDSISELASGKNVLAPGSGAETLQKTYPFLFDGKEKALLAEYREKLSGAADAQTKAIYQHAIQKTQALLEKKAQMKQRFIVLLRSISNSAEGALQAFTQPGFAEELVAMQGPEAAPPEPPPDDADENTNEEQTRE